MLEKLKMLKNGKNSVAEFCSFIRQGIPLAVFGVSESFKSYLVSQIDGKVLFVAKDEISAKKFSQEFQEYSGKKVVYIPPKDESLLITKAFSKDNSYARIKAFSQLPNADFCVVSGETLLNGCPKKIEKITLEKNQTISIDKLTSSLISLGYKRQETCESKGVFAVRGDVVDICTVDRDDLLRIDFFGDEIENIKIIDAQTRKFINNLDKANILQASEFIFDRQELERIEKILKLELDGKDKSQRIRLKTIIDDLNLAIENLDFDALQCLAPLSNNFGKILDYFTSGDVVAFDEAKRTYDLCALLNKEFNDRFSSLEKEGEVFSFSSLFSLDLSSLILEFKKFRTVALQMLSTNIPFFSPLKIINPAVSGLVNYQIDFKELFVDVDNWLKGGYRVLIFTGDDKRSEKLSIEFSERNILASVNASEIKGVNICDESLSSGFIFHEEKLVIIGSGNLYRKVNQYKKPPSKKGTFFTAPETGDYCVHEVHGIGKVLGNKRISTTEGTKDYIAVGYSGNDVLYIPVEQLDLLTRYLGADKNPRLSKIGGTDFERIKNSVKESIKKLSFDLKTLYAERKNRQGFKFVELKDLEQEFADDFPYEQTPDQVICDNEIKEDMTSSSVMDRLICGDVGFGKTEVAFRAVFRAISNGKQAVMLAPTTILAEQHFNTAVERFRRFGVRIACLNRFRKASEQKKILEQLKEGKIDFIIGTHRLLSRDVEFYDLGLLVLDEEQRFGVEHKEKIKLLKSDVDTLTLTATPIPRTLHMSLSGIRSISVINTPPKKRLPVQTYVTEETDALIKDAILKEINRGGQAFVLYNRVESIDFFANRIKSLLPDVRFTVAHGRMDERTLENNIIEFYNGKTDVMISTTIIENGIDLPKANTLIVIDADNLGLSTLYQLKGRVGRSDRLAYAYLTFKRDKILSQTAYERLNTIIEFTEMGSGIKVAMRDLEIRGAGNILGAEQHGHMDKIGYELYSKLLKEEMDGVEEFIPDLDIRISAYIPEKYIENNSAKMSIYKQIAEIGTMAEEKELISYLTETYGEIPDETANLIDLSAIKRYAIKAKAKKVVLTGSSATLTLENFDGFRNVSMRNALDEFSDYIKISVLTAPVIEFLNSGETKKETLKRMRAFLSKAVGANG